MIKAAIIGGAGYTAGELIRLLVKHPEVELKIVISESNSGKWLEEIHRDLAGDIKMRFSSLRDANGFSNIDLLFLCTGNGKSREFLKKNNIKNSLKCIDLSMDFRHNGHAAIQDRQFIYGLTELNKDKIVRASNIANPGCFATCIELAVLPLAFKAKLEDIHIQAITGSTGAGQSLTETTHFSWRQNNLSVYKPFAHQHEKEILETIRELDSTYDGRIYFIPVRGNFTRGIFCTAYLNTEISLSSVQDLYSKYYDESPFTHVVEYPVDLKQVINTNKCLIHLEKSGDILLITSVIDNLLKGASGQAVQNMNMMFGLEETTGLQLKSSFF